MPTSTGRALKARRPLETLLPTLEKSSFPEALMRSEDERVRFDRLDADLDWLGW